MIVLLKECSGVKKAISSYYLFFVRFFAAILLLAFPATTLAQSISIIDQFPETGGIGGGANALTGGFQEVIPLLSIGHGDGALSHSMQILGTEGIVSNNQPRIIVDDDEMGGLYSYNVILPGNARIRFQSVDASPENTSNFSEYINRGGSLSYLNGVYTYTSRSGAKLIFEEQSDGFARITRLTGPDGNIVQYSYIGENLSSIRNSYGYQLKFQLDGEEGEVRAINNAEEFCDANLNSCSLAETWSKGTGGPDSNTFIDAEDRNYSVSDNGGSARFVIYPQSGMTSIANYNSEGDLTRTQKLGFELDYSVVTDEMGTPNNDSDDERTFVTTYPDNSTMSVISKVIGNMVLSQTDQINRTTSYSYNPDNLVETITLPRGNRIEYLYDNRGNVTQTTRYPVSTSNLPPLVTKASFPVSCTSVNFRYCNKPIWTEDTNGQRTDYTYHANSGGVLTMVAPSDGVNGRARTEYSYIPLRAKILGNSGQIVQAPPVWKMNRVRQFAGVPGHQLNVLIHYDVDQNLVPQSMIVSGSGIEATLTKFTFDVYGNLVVTDGPKAGAFDKSFAFFDKLRRNIGSISIDPDGAGVRPREATRTNFTALGRVETVDVGTTTGSSLTALNNMTVLQTQRNSYEALTSILEGTRIEAGSTTYSRVDYSYDNMRRVECSALRMNPTLLASPHSDACSQSSLNTMFGPDRISKRDYDSAGRIEQLISAYGTPAQATESATYLSYGPVHTRSDANGNVTTYSYDGYSRLRRMDYPNKTLGSGTSNSSDFVRYDYDDQGRQFRVFRRDGTVITTEFDNLSRSKKVNISGNTSENVTITRDIAGRILGLSRQDSSLSFTYDALGRQLSESSANGTISHSYNAFSERTSTTYPGSDNFKVDYQYFTSGELKNISQGGQVLASYLYTDQGQRKSVTRGISNNVTNYDYDDVSRLRELENDIIGTDFDQTQTYTHMPSGQIKTSTNSNPIYDPGLTTYDQNFVMNGLNQIVSEDGLNYSYDNKGNLTASTGKSYDYDYANRLTMASDSSGVMANLTYDVLSRLHSIDTPSAADSRFAYDGQNMIAEYDDQTGALKTRFIHGPKVNEPLIRYDYSGGGTPVKEWYLMDRLGSVTGLADETGTSTAVNSYSHHGQPSAGNEGRFQYTGQVWLEEIGLYYYKARFYDPQIKRFLNPDPIGYADGMNIYAYVHGDPINGTDPTGLTGCTDDDPDCEEDVVVATHTKGGSKRIGITGRWGGGQFDVDIPNLPSLGGGGGGGSGDDSDNDDCLTIEAVVNQAAINAANQLRSLQSQDGNEHGFLIGLGPSGDIGLIGPFTSGSPNHISSSDVIFSLIGFEGSILGGIHNHPAMTRRTNPHAFSRDIIANNRSNTRLSTRDLRLDNDLSAAGFTVQPTFTHFVVGSDNQLRAFNEGNGNIWSGSRDVNGCNTS